MKDNPDILLYGCKARSKRKEKEEHDHIKKVRGCYGGTLLHVMVSQKPSLKKKRVNKARNILKIKNSDTPYKIHVMSSVPNSLFICNHTRNMCNRAVNMPCRDIPIEF